MGAISSRATKLAIIEETTGGVLKAPTAGTDYQPLRPGDTLSPSFDVLDNDEIVNSLGAGKPILGAENPSGSHPAYAKHSGVEGQAPEAFLYYKSAFGAADENAVEYTTTVGSTTTVLKSTNAATNFKVGQSLLIKDSVNGYSIRGIKALSVDDITLNFAVSVAPATGVSLGLAQFLYPATTGHPKFSTWKEYGSSEATEAVAGCTTTAIDISGTAGQQVEAAFEFVGTKYYFDPIEVTATNKYIDFTDDGGTVAAVLTEKWYSPNELASALSTAMNSVSTDTITVAYSRDSGAYTISADGAVFELLFATGTNAANDLEDVLGFSGDQTAALTYTGSEELHAIPGGFTPSYDSVDTLVAKNIELMLGDATDNICRAASTFSFKVGASTVDVPSICAASGVQEKLASAREATFDVTLVLDKHDAKLYSQFVANTGIGAMVNVGSKDSGDNWEAGKCASFVFLQSTLSQHELGGDDFVTLTISGKGYVTTAIDDVYLSFL